MRPGFWAHEADRSDCVNVKEMTFRQKGAGTGMLLLWKQHLADQQRHVWRMPPLRQDISANRLTAVPWSRYWHHCQELMWSKVGRLPGLQKLGNCQN